MTLASTPEARYARLASSLLKTGGVTQDSRGGKTRRFGADALKVNNTIFAMLTRGRLVVKLPRARVDELIASADGERFDAGKGRPMKEWLTVAAAASDAKWRSLAREALTFVGSKT